MDMIHMMWRIWIEWQGNYEEKCQEPHIYCYDLYFTHPKRKMRLISKIAALGHEIIIVRLCLSKLCPNSQCGKDLKNNNVEKI